MYNTGNAGFLTAACNSNRTIDTKATLAFLTGNSVLTTEDIVSYKITDASVAGKAFIPGSFVEKQLELSLNAASTQVSSINFKTSKVHNLKIEAGIQSDSMVYVPMGTFYPTKDGVTIGDDGYVSIKATDIPEIFKSQFASELIDFPCTIKELLSQMSTVIGIPIRITEADFPNLSVELTESFILTTTLREAMMYIAETLGAYVHMGRDGEVHFEKIFKGLVDPGCILDDNYLFSVKVQETSVKPFQYISIKANKDDLGVTQTVTGVTTECTYDIIDNPLTYGHPADFLAGLVKPTTFTEFYPAQISFHGRPDIDTGDVLKFVYKGVTYVLPVCNHVFEYNGGFKTTLESVGSDKLVVSSVDSSSKSKITALRQQINNLVRELSFTQSEIIDINTDITNISKVLQTAEALQTSISKLEGEVEKISTLTQTAEDLKLEIGKVAGDLKNTTDQVNANQQTILTYFNFQADGLTIGVNNSNIKLRLANNKVVFLKDDTNEVAYLSDGKLYVTDAHFLKSLILGNFEFVPRSNGNLSLRRRGGTA